MRWRIAIALLVPLAACEATGDPGVPPDAFGPFPDAGMTPCEVDLECPAPEADKLTVCGRLYDVEWGTPISGFLHADFHDSASYADDPLADPVLSREMYRYDACGRFIASGLTPPATGSLTIVVDDSPQGFPEDHVPTLVVVPVEAGNAYPAIPAWTLASWTESTWAGPIGANIRDPGTELVIHRVDGVPAAGVAIDIGTGSPQDAYAFGDNSVDSHTQIAPGVTTTGLNGAELRLGTAVAGHLLVTIDDQ